MTFLGMFESTADFWNFPPVVHICYVEGTIHMDARSTSWSDQSTDDVERNYELKCQGNVWKRIL